MKLGREAGYGLWFSEAGAVETVRFGFQYGGFSAGVVGGLGRLCACAGCGWRVLFGFCVSGRCSA